MKFNDQVVLVTGGGGGIGGATCAEFARAGAQVVVLDVAETAAQQTADDITAAGGNALAVACDIADRASVDAAIDQVLAAFGGIHVLVNNAGWDVFKPFLETERAEWDNLININLIGMLNMHHAVLPHMLSGGGGRIVNVASDAGRVGSSGEAVYAACKGGMIAFTKTIAREHARHNVTANVVCPGPTDTALFDGFKAGAANPEKLEAAFARSIPMGRIGQPDDLPAAILFFASPEAGFVTGQVVSVSGGLTMHG